MKRKKPSLHLRQKPGQYICCQNHLVDCWHWRQSIMDPVIRCTTLPSHSRSLKGLLFHLSRRSIHVYRLSHSELDDIEKVAVLSSLRSLNQNALLSLEPRDHPLISLGHISNMLAVSYTVKSKKIYMNSPTHYPCGIARTSEWYLK